MAPLKPPRGIQSRGWCSEGASVVLPEPRSRSPLLLLLLLLQVLLQVLLLPLLLLLLLQHAPAPRSTSTCCEGH